VFLKAKIELLYNILPDKSLNGIYASTWKLDYKNWVCLFQSVQYQCHHGIKFWLGIRQQHKEHCPA